MEDQGFIIIIIINIAKNRFSGREIDQNLFKYNGIIFYLFWVVKKKKYISKYQQFFIEVCNYFCPLKKDFYTDLTFKKLSLLSIAQ